MRPNESALAIVYLALLALFPLFAALFTLFAALFTLGWAWRGATLVGRKFRSVGSGVIPAASR